MVLTKVGHSSRHGDGNLEGGPALDRPYSSSLLNTGLMRTSHRDFKNGLYEQFARIGKTLGNAHRLELLDLLAQSERGVESLAAETELSVANASQHLQALRQAGLVESRRQGVFVHYRLADPAVFALCSAIRTVAERRLADLERLVHEHFGDRSNPEPVRMPDLIDRVRSNDVVILDARPANEYEAGHIAGAISVPIEELQGRLRTLPTGKDFVAYCRGPYCVYADRAVELLQASGRRARRLLEGFSEWQAAGHPVGRGRTGNPATRAPHRLRRRPATRSSRTPRRVPSRHS
jgi:DNA-binding transcriptional ArsR family regulator/rhodanese-related sulfurtransferase